MLLAEPLRQLDLMILTEYCIIALTSIYSCQRTVILRRPSPGLEWPVSGERIAPMPFVRTVQAAFYRKAWFPLTHARGRHNGGVGP